MAIVIEYKNGQTTRSDARWPGQFLYIDDTGRRLSLDLEELTVSEETCEGHRVEAAVSLPDPGTEAAVALLQAVLAAMEMDDYELVKKQNA